MRIKFGIVFAWALVFGLAFGKDEDPARYTSGELLRLARVAVERPSDALAQSECAWALLMAPANRDPREALDLARRAATLSEFKNPDVLDTLALANFCNGANAAEGAVFQQQACALLPGGLTIQQQTQMRSRLAFYKASAAVASLEKVGDMAAKLDVAKASNSLAWILLTVNCAFLKESSDVKLIRAWELAKKAVALTDSSNPYYLDTLALAEFKKGHAAEAMRLEELAVLAMPKCVDDANSEQRKEKLSMECSLELYKLSAAAENGRTWESFMALKGEGPGDKIPMILVHGDRSDGADYGTYCRWKTFVDSLEKSPLIRRNFDVFVWRHKTAEPVGFNGAMGNARELAEYIDSAFQRKPVMLVAHSRGGLVCRSFMNYKKQGDRVLGLITLGTPHHGSPEAVPDLVGISCSYRSLEDARAFGRFLGADCLDVWPQLFCKGGPGLAVERPGSVNLAWDNMDGFFALDEFPRDRYCLHQSDFNDTACAHSSYYPAALKTLCGTLAELNRCESYAKKIIAYGAYGTKNDKESSVWSAVKAQYEKWQGEDTTKQLRFAANVMSHLHDNMPFVKPNYVANDGLVPLQSALFLDVSGGKVFAEARHRGSVRLDQSMIEKSCSIRAIHILDNANHATFMEDPQRYWEMFENDVSALLGKPAEAVAPISAKPVPDSRTRPDPAYGGYCLLNETGRTLEFEKRWKKDDGTWTEWTSTDAPKGKRVVDWQPHGSACELRITQKNGAITVWPLEVSTISATQTASETNAKHYKITGSRKEPYALVEE